MSKRIFIHFGLHKTGTTSFQQLCLQERARLQTCGFDYYPGARGANHIELGLSVLREPLDAPIRREFPGVSRETFFRNAAARIGDFVKASPASQLVFSNETLSYARTVAEIERLKALFPLGHDLIPVLCLRNKQEWRASFAEQLRKMGVPPSDDPKSCAYLKDDSWLLDHEALVDAAP